MGYQSEIDEWRHKLDDLSLRHQAEIDEWNHKLEEQAVLRQMDSEDWGHKLNVQAAAHQSEIGEWKQKLGDQKSTHQIEINEWKRKLDAVQYRARLEHIVAVIAAHMISVDHEKVDDAITRSLQTMVKISGIDRGYLVLFAKDVYQELGQPAWYGYGSNSSERSVKDFTGDEFQWGMGRLSQLETIYIPRVADLTNDQDETIAYLQAKRIKSFTAIPMVSNRAVYGGDEFTIVLPEATLADVWRRAEQLRDVARRMEINYDGKQVGPITFSIGVAAYPDHGQTPDRVLLACDAASYASKSEGGDRIMMGHKVES